MQTAAQRKAHRLANLSNKPEIHGTVCAFVYSPSDDGATNNLNRVLASPTILGPSQGSLTHLGATGGFRSEILAVFGPYLDLP